MFYNNKYFKLNGFFLFIAGVKLPSRKTQIFLLFTFVLIN